MKTIELIDKFEVEIKRLYLPLVVHVDCPHCGLKNMVDFDRSYLSNPILNSAEPIYIYCEDCEGESEFDLTLRMSVNVDTKARKL